MIADDSIRVLFSWLIINFDFAFLITFALHLFTLSSNCKSEYTRRYNGCRNRFKVGLPTHCVILILLLWVKWTHLHSNLHFFVDCFIIFFDCCLLGIRNIRWNCGSFFYIFSRKKWQMMNIILSYTLNSSCWLHLRLLSDANILRFFFSFQFCSYLFFRFPCLKKIDFYYSFDFFF